MTTLLQGEPVAPSRSAVSKFMWLPSKKSPKALSREYDRSTHGISQLSKRVGWGEGGAARGTKAAMLLGGAGHLGMPCGVTRANIADRGGAASSSVSHALNNLTSVRKEES